MVAQRASAIGDGRFAFQAGLIVLALAAVALWQIVSFAIEGITLADVMTTLVLGLATSARVVVLIAIASVIWVPIGVWVGVRPRVANHGAAGGAIPCRLPGQSAVSDRGLDHRRLEARVRISGSAR